MLPQYSLCELSMHIKHIHRVDTGGGLPMALLGLWLGNLGGNKVNGGGYHGGKEEKKRKRR